MHQILTPGNPGRQLIRHTYFWLGDYFAKFCYRGIRREEPLFSEASIGGVATLAGISEPEGSAVFVKAFPEVSAGEVVADPESGSEETAGEGFGGLVNVMNGFPFVLE